ncbi:DUF6188 family protein [Kitasatospora gansuensis]
MAGAVRGGLRPDRQRLPAAGRRRRGALLPAARHRRERRPRRADRKPPDRSRGQPGRGLELAFDSGRRLVVPPDTAEHPWQILGPDGPLFTAEPGGYLTG